MTSKPKHSVEPTHKGKRKLSISKAIGKPENASKAQQKKQKKSKALANELGDTEAFLRPDDYPKLCQQELGVTEVHLLLGQQLSFVGCALIKVLAGAVEVMGKLLDHRDPPLTISTGGRTGQPLTITSAPDACPHIPCQAPSLTHLTLESLSGLPPVMTHHQPSDTPSYTVQPCTAGTSAALCVPVEWQAALSRICVDATGAPVSVAVTGPKGAGKSTFCRLLVNALLNLHPTVILVETDCGQPELHPPGLVSATRLHCPLVGPPHVHMTQPNVAFHIGATSPQANPALYAAAIRQLLWQAAAWQGRGPVAGTGDVGMMVEVAVPMVVNTQGWVKGLGLQLLGETLRQQQPSHVVQIRTSAEKKNLPRGTFWTPPTSTHTATTTAAPPTSPLICKPNLPHNQPSTSVRPSAPTPSCPPPYLIYLPSVCETGEDEGGRAPNQRHANQGTSSPARGVASPGRTGTLGSPAYMSPGRSPGSAPHGRQLRPADCRVLMWHSWSRTLLGWQAASGGFDSGDTWATATGLAVLPPYELSLDHVTVDFMYAGVPESEICHAINAQVVALLTDMPKHHHHHHHPRHNSTTRPLQQRLNQDESALMTTATSTAGTAPPLSSPVSSLPSKDFGDQVAPPPTCVGMALVRAVDPQLRRLYLITPTPPALLETVKCLQVGGQEFPGSLQGSLELQPPYAARGTLGSEATGGAAMKARRNLPRSSQLNRK